ncbi:helix-turn-helix transcriptional regulator [Candidatus Poriferisodalis sp.]|uniref:helix-turn-helix transcriptional regulator n=1 Tax=Candidatus Poriferisodalis sp. TaxID=3101277 RepID=UPI003B01616F
MMDAEQSAPATELPVLVLTSAELQKILKISRTTLYRHVTTAPGFPKPIKIGNVKRWRFADVQAYLAGMPDAGAA